MTASDRPGILVTGGTGFLGAALIDRLVAEGRHVVAMNRSRAAIRPEVEVVSADLSDHRSFRHALDGLRATHRIDAIVHLAVSRHHREFPTKALDLFHVNAMTAAELLDFARLAGVRTAVFGSTGTVYSSTTSSDDDQTPGNDESEFRAPASYFAATKLFADAMAEQYRILFPVSVLRFYAPYGPGLTGRMLNDLVDRVRTGRPLTLPQSGPGLAFSAVYVDDALDVIIAAMEQSWNETINVAAPETWSIESAGQLIGRLTGHQPIFERGPARSAPRIVPSVRRLQGLMPDRAFIGLEAGLQRMLEAASGSDV
jgi:nucleoside-diphosphate-sugar epimerase